MNLKPFFFVLGLVAAPAFAADEEAVQTSTHIATVNSEGKQVIEMKADSFSFTPNRIVVKVGKPVVLKVAKDGIIPHDLTIDDPQSGIAIKENLDSDTLIEFTPLKTGNFKFYCGKKFLFFESHEAKGMHGVIEVVE